MLDNMPVNVKENVICHGKRRFATSEIKINCFKYPDKNMIPKYFLEYSGKYLGIMFLSGYLKQLILISLVANLLFPWHMTFSFTFTGILSSIGIYLLKIVLVSFLIAIIETIIAKIRLFRVRDILIASFVMSVIALVL